MNIHFQKPLFCGALKTILCATVIRFRLGLCWRHWKV